MCRTQCLLTLVALHVGLAHSWDIAVGVGDELIFYSNGTVTDTVNLFPQNLTALAYDIVNNMMLYVDRQSNNDAICGYDISSRETKCFVERNGRNIHSIAFDPATQTLFFTDTNNNSINWISLKPGTVNVTTNLLIKMDDRTPSDIAVDSCSGYIYWTNINNYNQSMERARFNGSGREIISLRKGMFERTGVLNLVVDPLTREIYYFAGYKWEHYKYEILNRVDLNGKNERTMYGSNYNNGHYSAAKELTVSKYYLYWVNSTRSDSIIWRFPKNAKYFNQPIEIKTFYTEKPVTVATNYKIEDQIQGLQDCEALSSLIHKITVTNRSLNTDQTKETESTIEYTKDVDGYIGERCEVSVCQNYCLHGNCSLNDEGLPTCRCNAGYSGRSCEVYACHGYCLNEGECTLNEEHEPICQCAGNHEGSRCEAVKDFTYNINNTPTYYSAKRNLTLADLLSNWRKPSARVTVTVEV